MIGICCSSWTRSSRLIILFKRSTRHDEEKQRNTGELRRAAVSTDSVCVCERGRESVCVCVWERERECVCVCVRERERECVCVCERERERERENNSTHLNRWENFKQHSLFQVRCITFELLLIWATSFIYYLFCENVSAVLGSNYSYM